MPKSAGACAWSGESDALVKAERGAAPLGGVNPAPNDNNPVPAPPGGNFGTSFTDPAGASVRWVVFRPDGVPVAFDAACNLGATGTGGGAVYFTNTRRDYAVVLSPLGGVRVHSWDPGAGAWRI